MLKRIFKAATGWNRLSERDRYIRQYRYSSVLAGLLSPLPVPMAWLLRLFGSDKQSDAGHSYGRTYGALFRRRKYRRINLLEIGIGGYRDTLGGRSLLAWQAYFPLGKIVAADIEPKLELAGRRRRIVCLDQSSETDLAALREQEGTFDIIIDDGSHFNAHQIMTFKHLFSALREGGVYVIEDVQTSFWPGDVIGVTWDGAAIGDPSFSRTCYGFFLELAKYLNHAEFVRPRIVDEALLTLGRQITRISFEHNLIIVHKGHDTMMSARAARMRPLVAATA